MRPDMSNPTIDECWELYRRYCYQNIGGDMSPATATRKVHIGDPAVFHIPMGAWYVDPSHVIGYTVGNRKDGTQRDMMNSWRCAVVRWVIRRLLV